VENQILEYWGDRHQQIILSCDRRKVGVSYIPNIVQFREEHVVCQMELPKKVLHIEGVRGAREYFHGHLSLTKTLSHLRHSKPSFRTAEHEMFCLPIPKETDPEYGDVISRAISEDADGVAWSSNIIPFTSLNLLRHLHTLVIVGLFAFQRTTYCAEPSIPVSMATNLCFVSQTNKRKVLA
jgi:hypothetical protein